MNDQPSTTHRWLSRYRVEALLAALTVVFFYRVFFLGQVLYWGDTLLQAVPWRHFVKQMFARGELPLWNPYIFCGLPFVANPQPGVYYPLSLLTLFLPVPLSISLDAALHVFLAGLSMYLYLREVRRTETGSLIGALSFMFGGFLIVKLQFQSTYRVLAWMPFVMWRLERLRLALLEGDVNSASSRRVALRQSLWLGAALALQWMGGQLQVSILLVAYWGAYAVMLIRPLVRDSRESPLRVILLTLVLPGVMMVGLTALQWLPALELVGVSTRTDMTYEKAMAFSFPPWQLLTLVIPNFYGSPQFHNYWGAGNDFEVCAYAGVLTLLLAWFGAWWGGRAETLLTTGTRGKQTVDSLRRFWLGMSIAGLLLSMGGYSPIYRALYHSVPLFQMLRAPARFLLWYAFSVPCLAALGWDAFVWKVREQPAVVRRWLGRLKAVGIAGLIGLLVVLLASSPLAPVFERFVRFCFSHSDKSAPSAEIPKLAASLFISVVLFSVVAWVVYLLCFSALHLFHVHGLSSPRVQWVVVGALTVDVFLFGMNFNPMTSPEVFNTPPDLPRSVIRNPGSRVLLPLESINRLWAEYYSYSAFGSRDETFIRTPLRYGIPCINMAQGIYSAEGYDPIRYLPYDRKLRQWEAGLEQAWGEPGEISTPAPVSLVVKAPEQVRFYQTPLVRDAGSAPRVRFEPVFATTPPTVPDWRDEINRVTFHAHNRRWSTLYMSDVLYPGWLATVNGRPTPILPEEEVFRRLDLPGGDVRGEFVYYPRSFRFGLFVTLCFIGAVVAMLSTMKCSFRAAE